MGSSRQEYWSELPFPSPGGLPDPGIEPLSLLSPALAGMFFATSATWEACSIIGGSKFIHLFSHFFCSDFLGSNYGQDNSAQPVDYRNE